MDSYKPWHPRWPSGFAWCIVATLLSYANLVMSSTKDGDVDGSIKFIEWQDLYDKEKPFETFMRPPKDAIDQRTTNVVFHEKTIRFHDGRQIEGQFGLDTHAFQLYQYPTSFDQFWSQEAVEKAYLPEIEDVIKSVTEGVGEIKVFDWRVMPMYICVFLRVLTLKTGSRYQPF